MNFLFFGFSTCERYIYIYNFILFFGLSFFHMYVCVNGLGLILEE